MAESPFKPGLEGLSRILAHLPTIVTVVARDGTIRYINHTAHGYTPDDFIGTNGRELVHPEHRHLFDENLEALEVSGEPQEYQIHVQVDGGLDAWFRTRMFRLGDAASCSEVLMVSDDISEEKRLRDEAATLRQLLPICAWCNRIRDATGAWSDLKDYLSRGEKTSISHGICPDCSEGELGLPPGIGPSHAPEAADSDGSAA